MEDLLHKGNYKPIDKAFLSEGLDVLREVDKVQDKYNKHDTDTFINELRDSMAGYYLGYGLVNTDKHGFDCKKSESEDVFLEVKSASFTASTWGATFNDTNLEKARCFQSPNVYLCLAVWKNASDLLFVAYGQNSEIGKFLENKVNRFLEGNGGVRSTQSLGISQLVFDYGFDIICVSKSKEEIKQQLQIKNRRFFGLKDSQLLDLTEFNKKYKR